MLEFTGVASVLRGISVLYWLIAAAALIAVFWRIKSWRGKTIGAIAVVAVFGFMPVKGYLEAQKRHAYAREAWAYFKKLCDEKSGQKIYKTFTGVKSVLIVKPLPPATEKDLYDQYWYGDPYSNATPMSDRAGSVAETLISRLRLTTLSKGGQPGFEFVELKRIENDVERFQRLAPLPNYPHSTKTEIDKPVSRFGVTWEDISAPEDRKHWVAGSRLRIIDLTNNSVVGERIGFFIEAGFGSGAGNRRPWLTSRGPSTTCPSLRNGTFEDRLFIRNVFPPQEEQENGK